MRSADMGSRRIDVPNGWNLFRHKIRVSRPLFSEPRCCSNAFDATVGPHGWKCNAVAFWVSSTQPAVDALLDTRSGADPRLCGAVGLHRNSRQGNHTTGIASGLVAPGFWKGLAGLSARLIATYLGIGVIVAVHWIAFYESIKLSDASVAATCMALAPLFVAFIEPQFVGRRFEFRELFFGVAVIPGVALVVGGIPSEMRAGLAVGIFSALLAAIFGTLNKRYIEYVGVLTVTGLEMLAGVVCLTLIASLVPPSDSIIVKPNGHDAVLLLILAMGCTLLPFALSLVALRQLSAFTTALAINMDRVYAICLSIIRFHEQLELNFGFYLGVAIVFVVVFSHTQRVRVWQNFLSIWKLN